MPQFKLGLVNVLLGPVGATGGMGTTLAPIGDTVLGTPTFNTTAPTDQEFKIEEQDAAVFSITTDPGSMTFAWSTYNIEAATMQKFFGGTITGGATAGVFSLGAITGGSGYTDGSHSNVALTGGAGTGAVGTVVVSGGSVTSVTITTPGTGYAANDALSASTTDIGAGTGFTVHVATVATTGGTYDMPNQLPEVEQSMALPWKNGGTMELARVKLTSKPSFSFKKTALSQLDIVATILQPTDGTTPSLRIRY